MPGTSVTINVRRIHTGEEHLLWQIFYASIHEVAHTHYSAEQLEVWAPAGYPGESWVSRIQNNYPLVAELNGRVAGFADVQLDGYIDHFFVAGFAVRQGVGARLMQQIHFEAAKLSLQRLYSDVSLSAQKLFLQFGFVIEAEQIVVKKGVALRNAKMYKKLDSNKV
jgi:putative acetyltransferase